MAPLKNPLFSLTASGRLTRAFTLARRLTGPGWLLRGRPADPKTEPQLSWRTMWQLATSLWHQLSAAEQAAWESAGTARGMTGYAWYMSQALRPNPGIYLPLAGGTMSGEIDMNDFAIGGLIDPTTDDKAARKAYVDDLALPHTPKDTLPNLPRWRVPGWYCSTFAAQAMTPGDIYYIPIFVSRPTTYIRVGLQVQAGAAGTADLRLFAFTNGLPAALISSYGTVDTTLAVAKEIIITEPLTRDYYYLAIRCTGAPSLYCPQLDQALYFPSAGFNLTVKCHLAFIIPFVNAAYADPAPAPTGVKNAKFATVLYREN